MKSTILLLIVNLVVVARAVDWQRGNWAFACDFRNNDIGNARVRGEDCGSQCNSNPACTHFTWTWYNGGTCWMKGGPVGRQDAFDTGDRSMVCGFKADTGPPSPGRNILATRHVNGGGDACALPQTNYAVTMPFALGDVAELGNLRFTPDLCGHVFRIDCGHGSLDIIVTNSNLGGGLDLYSETTWPRATGNAPPGETRCSAVLTDQNPIWGGAYQCFYKPGTGANNPYYRNIGLLNTGNKIVTDASLSGRCGEHRGSNPYFAFDQGRPIDGNEQVTFFFQDGSTHSVRFYDCRDVGAEQQWR